MDVEAYVGVLAGPRVVFHGFAGSTFLVDDPPEYEVGVDEPVWRMSARMRRACSPGSKTAGANAMTSPSGVHTAPSRA